MYTSSLCLKTRDIRLKHKFRRFHSEPAEHWQDPYYQLPLNWSHGHWPQHSFVHFLLIHTILPQTCLESSYQMSHSQPCTDNSHIVRSVWSYEHPIIRRLRLNHGYVRPPLARLPHRLLPLEGVQVSARWNDTHTQT